MKKKIVLTGLVAAAMLGFGTAQATSVSSALYSGIIQLSDNSAEYLINPAGVVDTKLDVGDKLRGIFTMETVEQLATSQTKNLTPPINELSGIFEIEVTAKTTIGGAIGGGTCASLYCWTFGPSASFQSTYGTGAMVAWYEDPTHEFTRLGASIATLEGNVTDGALYWVSGFSGVGGAAAAGEFWQAGAVTDDLSVVGGIPAPGNGGTYNSALNLLTDNSGLTIYKVACFDQLALSLGLVDQCGSGSLLGTGGANTPYDSFDNVDVVMSIPEPTSVLLMGLGLVGMGATVISRRRRATA
jgi:hypothetical protein